MRKIDAQATFLMYWRRNKKEILMLAQRWRAAGNAGGGERQKRENARVVVKADICLSGQSKCNFISLILNTLPNKVDRKQTGSRAGFN